MFGTLQDLQLKVLLGMELQSVVRPVARASMPESRRFFEVLPQVRRLYAVNRHSVHDAFLQRVLGAHLEAILRDLSAVRPWLAALHKAPGLRTW